MSEVLVDVDGVAKKFCRDLKTSLWYGLRDLGSELVGSPPADTLRGKEFWAIDDVSFQLRRGEAMAIIGANGAGKSTLLKMLVGVIKPTKGHIRMRGRVQALIELGAGFNPILTGRENIYINAAVLGIPRAEVDAKLDDIIEYAELEQFIDAPLQSYSSGMKVRLGFSVATHVNPDILIIDEVLAVGDARFRRKARNSMQALLDRDVALIFISHNMHEVLGITQRALWLERGKVRGTGTSAEIVADYMAAAIGEKAGPAGPYRYMPKRSAEVIVTDVVADPVDEPPRRLQITLQASAKIDERVLHGLYLRTDNGLPVGKVVFNDHITANPGDTVTRTFELDLSVLNPGLYMLAYELATDGGPRLEGIENLVEFAARQRMSPTMMEVGEVNYARIRNTNHGPLLISARMVDVVAPAAAAS